MRQLSSTPRGVRLAILGLLAACFLTAGCGRKVGSITGKVTYQGKALKGGNVSFVSTDGGMSFASSISEEGVYTIPNLQSGSYKVCVETESLKGHQEKGPVMPGSKTGGIKNTGPPPDAKVPEGYTPSDPAAMAAGAGLKRYTAIPAKYAETGTTDLTYEFSGGSDTYNIDLK